MSPPPPPSWSAVGRPNGRFRVMLMAVKETKLVPRFPPPQKKQPPLVPETETTRQDHSNKKTQGIANNYGVQSPASHRAGLCSNPRPVRGECVVD